LCITIDNQDTLDRVENYVSGILSKYPNSNPNNHRIGKLGEQAVYKVINDLHKFNLSRSSYKSVYENYVAKKPEEEQEKISELVKKCKVPSNYEYDVLQPVH
jgi:nicotinamide mononucleotide adenylyltransferase